LSRLNGGKPADERDATVLVTAVERIRRATGATVLVCAHVSQTGATQGGGQEIVRGSTALVDGVRWVATMQRPTEREASRFGISGDDADTYVRFSVAKSNYTAPQAGQWLHRGPWGILERVDLSPRSTPAKADTAYQDVLA